MDEKREVVLWGCDPNAEILSANDRDEAIESHLDGSDIWDGKINVYGYARMVIPADSPSPERVVEDMLCCWEEYTDPENGPDITEEMVEAAKEFIKIMRSELHIWACEIITTENVDVVAWINKNRPDWMEEKDS